MEVYITGSELEPPHVRMFLVCKVPTVYFSFHLDDKNVYFTAPMFSSRVTLPLEGVALGVVQLVSGIVCM